jgi:RNA polymerase sigma-70 factor, ECF subfamily
MKHKQVVPMTATDEKLIAESLGGSRSAFRALVDRYRDGLCGLAYCYLGSFDDAQDVAQEVLVYAYLHLRELRDAGRFSAWLRRMTLHRCADRLRSRERWPVSLEAGASDAPTPTAEIDGTSAPGRPDERLEQLATRMMVQQALGRLTEKARLTITLFYFSGYSHAQIAAFLGIPRNTVRSRLQHAKRQLREEMMTMVGDVMSEGRPDPEFTQRVVEEAIRRGNEAVMTHTPGAAIGHYDEALTTLQKMPATPERRRTVRETLLKKGDASRFPRGLQEAVHLYEQSLALAEELGDLREQAGTLMKVGVHTPDLTRRMECYRKALALYRETGDRSGQADCLFWLGREHLGGHDAGRAASCCSEALALLTAPHSAGNEADIRIAALCGMVLQLTQEVGAAFPRLLSWSVSCDGLREAASCLAFGPHSDIRHLSGDAADRGVPTALRARSAFAQIAHSRKLIDANVPVGGSWSCDSWSYSSQPLETTVTVRGDGETVSVPAGTFTRCLLLEQVVAETERGDDAPQQNRQANRDSLCGTRRAWFAPGIGLVQLAAINPWGGEERLQLQEYSVQTPGDAALPLAVGNTWSYTWAGLPNDLSGMEVYRVGSRVADTWYVESFGYLLPS